MCGSWAGGVLVGRRRKVASVGPAIEQPVIRMRGGAILELGSEG